VALIISWTGWGNISTGKMFYWITCSTSFSIYLRSKSVLISWIFVSLLCLVGISGLLIWLFSIFQPFLIYILFRFLSVSAKVNCLLLWARYQFQILKILIFCPLWHGILPKWHNRKRWPLRVCPANSYKVHLGQKPLIWVRQVIHYSFENSRSIFSSLLKTWVTASGNCSNVKSFIYRTLLIK